MIFNATPHEIVLYSEDKKAPLWILASTQLQIRLKTIKQEYIKTISDFPIWSAQEFIGLDITGGKLEDLEKDDGNLYVVSLPVKSFINEVAGSYKYGVDWKIDKKKFLTVDSNEGAVRNEKGQIIGTTRLLM